jgi:peptidoglycan hydrolase-like protein with peptidoglycan-binding domain
VLWPVVASRAHTSWVGARNDRAVAHVPVTVPAEPRQHAALVVPGDHEAVTGPGLLRLQQSAGNQAAVAAVQRKAAGKAGSRPTALIGSSGEHVGVLQQKLNATRSAVPPLIIDARFGSKTFTAARKFQKANKLTADGAVGKKTWAALDLAAPGGGIDSATLEEKKVANPDGADPVAIPDAGTSIHPTVSAGPPAASGPAVTELQEKLNTSGAKPPVPITNAFDAATKTALTAFQTAQGLTPDGIANGPTWAKLDAVAPGSSTGRVERDWHENVGGNPNIGMTSRYTWEIKADEIHVVSKVKFTGNTPKATWPGFVTSAWNKFKAVKTGTEEALNISFELKPVASGEDNSVKVTPGEGRANAGEWFLGDTDEANTIAHEYGHLVGLQDEYQLTAADYERTTGSIAPVGVLESAVGSSSATVAKQFKKAMAKGDDNEAHGAACKAVVDTHGLKQGAFSQQVGMNYKASEGTDFVTDLLAAVSGATDEFEVMEPFTYSSGSMMGDDSRHADPHDHGVQPRHVREFVAAIQNFKGGTWEVKPR